MLQLFRTRVCCLATALFLALGTVSAPLEQLLHGDTPHGDACVLVAVAHDASAHHVRAGAVDDHHPGAHCLACHWARSFRSSSESYQLPGRNDAVRRLQVHPDAVLASAPVRAHRSPRAPPVASSSQRS